jgi:ubiquinone/menaquinone biosynthesis C-methylase UbiE
MNSISYWNFSKDTIRESAIDMRSLSSVNYHKKILSDKNNFQKWAFGSRYDCLVIAEQITGPFKGVVLEAGAGTGLYSCHMAKKNLIEKVIPVEYSKTCVEELMTETIRQFNLTPEEEAKIHPTVGSFNEIKLPDDSVDFIIAMGSLHHSEDRDKTLKELYRILKVGGFLIACERASYNEKTNAQLNHDLEIEFDEEFKRSMGYDVHEKYTRRMNSEHDPLLAEWEYLIPKNGFKPTIFWFEKSFLDFNKPLKIASKCFSKLVFSIIGYTLMRKKITQIKHQKIPYYPWFTKSEAIDPILIIAEKMPWSEMP